MARGARGDPKTIACPVCRRHVTSPGWCDQGGVGMIGNVAIRDRRAFDRAAAAVTVLHKAVAMLPRCQYCAMAMVTDTECPVDRTTWKNASRYRRSRPSPPPRYPEARSRIAAQLPAAGARRPAAIRSAERRSAPRGRRGGRG
jgi:hypothetical protein